VQFANISFTGLMEFVSSSHGIARDLRKHVVFKCFPVMCPDGVFLGNSRCTLLGADINRSWHVANKFQHPLLWKVKQYIIDQSKVLIFNFLKGIN
jgi:murein tripeptide amidase MpaA